MTKADLIAQNAALLAMVADLRIALGDDGKRMQPELVEYARELRANAARYEWLRSRLPGSTYRIAGVIYSEGGAGVDAAIDAAAKATE